MNFDTMGEVQTTRYQRPKASPPGVFCGPRQSMEALRGGTRISKATIVDSVAAAVPIWL